MRNLFVRKPKAKKSYLSIVGWALAVGNSINFAGTSAFALNFLLNAAYHLPDDNPLTSPLKLICLAGAAVSFVGAFSVYGSSVLDQTKLADEALNEVHKENFKENTLHPKGYFKTLKTWFSFSNWMAFFGAFKAYRAKIQTNLMNRERHKDLRKQAAKLELSKGQDPSKAMNFLLNRAAEKHFYKQNISGVRFFEAKGYSWKEVDHLIALKEINHYSAQLEDRNVEAKYNDFYNACKESSEKESIVAIQQLAKEIYCSVLEQEADQYGLDGRDREYFINCRLKDRESFYRELNPGPWEKRLNETARWLGFLGAIANGALSYLGYAALVTLMTSSGIGLIPAIIIAFGMLSGVISSLAFTKPMTQILFANFGRVLDKGLAHKVKKKESLVAVIMISLFSVITAFGSGMLAFVSTQKFLPVISPIVGLFLSTPPAMLVLGAAAAVFTFVGAFSIYTMGAWALFSELRKRFLGLKEPSIVKPGFFEITSKIIAVSLGVSTIVLGGLWTFKGVLLTLPGLLATFGVTLPPLTIGVLALGVALPAGIMIGALMGPRIVSEFRKIGRRLDNSVGRYLAHKINSILISVGLKQEASHENQIISHIHNSVPQSAPSSPSHKMIVSRITRPLSTAPITREIDDHKQEAKSVPHRAPSRSRANSTAQFFVESASPKLGSFRHLLVLASYEEGLTKDDTFLEGVHRIPTKSRSSTPIFEHSLSEKSLPYSIISCS